ncbi:SRPBCC family protein [Maribacter sp. 2210JD10-5]|uniref:SRPBCC family protein n=1 Tax=Maribacter sp. 2210JD10-5 TaxID=3386272 RepID=UPI0039BC931E
MKDVIIKEQLFDHSIDKIWKAISTGEEISKWFINADFKPVEGYAYTFTAGPEKDCTEITGVVKKATPYTLIYTWIVENTDVETTVKWHLEEISGKTKLILEHSGISNYGNEDIVTTMFGHFNAGWDNCVSLLTKHLTEEVNAG